MSRHVSGKAAKITSARKSLAVLQLLNFTHKHHSGVKINISRAEPPARPHRRQLTRRGISAASRSAQWPYPRCGGRVARAPSPDPAERSGGPDLRWAGGGSRRNNLHRSARWPERAAEADWYCQCCQSCHHAPGSRSGRNWRQSYRRSQLIGTRRRTRPQCHSHTSMRPVADRSGPAAQCAARPQLWTPHWQAHDDGLPRA
jgi:hypothetical protein